MCSLHIWITHLLIIYSSITLSQGQKNKKGKTDLVVYDPSSNKQTSSVDVGTKPNDEEEGVSLVNLPLYWVPCKCTAMQCNCCIGIRLKNQNIDKKVCFQLTLVLASMTLKIQIKLEDRILLNTAVSLLKPPTICMPTFLPVPLLICLQLSDIVLPIGVDFEGCFTVLLKFLSQKIFQVKLGCVRLGKGGVKFFKPTLVEEIVSAEDGREDIIRGDNDGISLEGI